MLSIDLSSVSFLLDSFLPSNITYRLWISYLPYDPYVHVWVDKTLEDVESTFNID